MSVGPFCIPLFFNLLGPNKKGNSSFEDRKTILNLLLQCFGVKRISYLLGDRESIGEKWLNYLKDYNIPFFQRLRENGQPIANASGKIAKSADLFHHIKIAEEYDLGLT